ncbi:MAG TPA: efflux RND transporter periplasmic adaptor subunit [Pseudorhodoplanes sp.]|nr:efflux RND transporter periplasmic adaptor subunit [Pseudorhodoplanes sp.]
MRRFRPVLPVLAVLAAGLAACGEDNRYVAPPPSKVTVAPPAQRQITPYLDATGNTTAINTVNLVARVAGFVQEIKYSDGDFVKKGTPLFVIEPEPYKLKLDQAKGSQDSAEAALKQSEAEFKRQADLVSRQVSTPANYDKALAQRDSDRGSLEQAQSNTAQAAINYGYTTVMAPFDGIVTARQVSIGELVGSTSPTTLATIVQLDPIYVNFTISEREVLIVRSATIATQGRGLTQEELKRIPVEVGLQTETGFPHKGTIDYASPSVDQSTGTLSVRGILKNPDRALLPGYFVRVRIPGPPRSAVLVPEIAVGSDQAGRYVLVVGKNDIVEQRKVEIGSLSDGLRVIEKGLVAEDRVVVAGVLRAIPGQKVEPVLQTPAGATK